MEYIVEPIEIDTTAPNNKEWRRLMEAHLKTATHYEIHCWNEEEREIALALRQGKMQRSKWEFGKVIAGPVNRKFSTWLLGLPKPTDTEIYNKMTPFFSIFLDNGFSSEHYGTELNQVRRNKIEHR